MTGSDDVTALLQAWQDGDTTALDRLSPFVYQELRNLAGRYMRSERSDHTLQATALVNEAFIRLAGGDIDYENRKHFFVVAARMMRRVLVDHARSRSRQKRGAGALHLTVADEARLADERTELPILALDEALSQLAERDERAAKAIELVYFGGLSIDEAADALGIAASTAYEDIRFARAWIKNAIA